LADALHNCDPIADPRGTTVVDYGYPIGTRPLFPVMISNGNQTRAGDSGGPAYTNNTAIGLVLGHNPDTGNGVATYVGEAERRLGVVVTTQ